MTTPSRPRRLWTCPRCRRKFAKRKQWHSCRPQTVERHLRGRPATLRHLYRALVAALRTFGPVRIDAVPSSINLISTHHFGGIVLRRDYLRLGFLSDRAIKDLRIVRREVVGPRRIGHYVQLRSLRDLDPQLLGWLRRAHALQWR